VKVKTMINVTLTRKIFNLDLRYYDTNLSKEDCFVFTGDPNAAPGGSIDPVRNPQGLTSRRASNWCRSQHSALPPRADVKRTSLNRR
jgi:hypothetical protein